MNVNRYLKAIAGAVIAGLGALQIAYIDNVLSTQEIITIAIVFVTALGGIWAVPNAHKQKVPMTPEEIRALEIELSVAKATAATTQLTASGVVDKPPTN